MKKMREPPVKKKSPAEIWFASYGYTNADGEHMHFDFAAISKEAAERHVLVFLVENDAVLGGVAEQTLLREMLRLRRFGYGEQALVLFNNYRLLDDANQSIQVVIEKARLLT